MLNIHHFHKTFGSTVVLNDISLSVEKNTIVGLAGPSGSGKSTLLRCIQQLEKPDAGTYECDGKMGFMFQDFQLFPHMTVLQNLIYAPHLTNKSSNHRSQATELLQHLGITDKQDMYPHKLSGGQKQRVALARSLMMQPQLLLCDEPTSGLDVATTMDVVTLLQNVRAMGVTMLIASHDLDFLTQMADRIIVLKNGSIVLDVAPRTLPSPIDYLKEYY
jgi:polar amino acid transport system ATP-binding protein